jgi:hypothetical protein
MEDHPPPPHALYGFYSVSRLPRLSPEERQGSQVIDTVKVRMSAQTRLGASELAVSRGANAVSPMPLCELPIVLRQSQTTPAKCAGAPRAKTSDKRAHSRYRMLYT